MANNNQDAVKSERSFRAANRKIDQLSDRLDVMYRDMHLTSPADKDQLDRITSDLSKSVNDILSSNSDVQSIPDISQLYSRIQRKTNVGVPGINNVTTDLMDIMSNQALMNTMMADPEINRYIRAKDLQIDMILKYMPKLKEALNIKKDNVLSSDNFNKTFLNPTTKESTTVEESNTFAKKAKALIEKYDLETRFEEIYNDTAKYGEQFVYIVPYKTAIERLMDKTNKANITGYETSIFESTTLIEGGKVLAKNNTEITQTELNEINNDSFNGNVTLTFNNTGILEDVLLGYKRAEDIIQKNKGMSLYEAFSAEMEILKEGEESIRQMSDTGKAIDTTGIRTNKIRPATRTSMDRITPDNLEYDKMYQHANDGLIYDKGLDTSKIKDIPGCVFRVLKHENVIPIYIENVCLGYYYIEFKYNDPNEDLDRSKLVLNNTFDTIHKKDMKDDHDIVLKYIASKISQSIDAKFINNNQDLKEEIYIILKYNQMFNTDFADNNVCVTYLSPKDVYHCYFELDHDLHRGISDLEDALLPALFWVLLELTTTMGIASRSQDHRVFYVRQNVEANISKTLMNVVNQLKKGNMGIRQVQSINSILGIIGKYNDYVIPVGPSGDAAVTFDTIQGQQIETPKELMDKYEENAVNATDVPLELVNSTNQADYATRYVMQNSKFLRKILKRQAIVQRIFSELFRRVYNYEYEENDYDIAIQLPPPLFLSSVNSLALINNVNEYAKACIEIEFPEGVVVDDKVDPEQLKAETLNLFVRQLLAAYVDTNNLGQLREQAKINILARKENEQTDTTGEAGGEELGGEEPEAF